MWQSVCTVTSFGSFKYMMFKVTNTHEISVPLHYYLYFKGGGSTFDTYQQTIGYGVTMRSLVFTGFHGCMRSPWKWWQWGKITRKRLFPEIGPSKGAHVSVLEGFVGLGAEMFLLVDKEETHAVYEVIRVNSLWRCLALIQSSPLLVYTLLSELSKVTPTFQISAIPIAAWSARSRFIVRSS